MHDALSVMSEKTSEKIIAALQLEKHIQVDGT